MADQRISQLTKLAQADVAANDVLAIVDIGASVTKKVEAKDLFQAGANLADSASIDLAKLNQASVTKLGAAALATGAVTAVKLAADSSIAVQTTAPVADNFEGRGYFDSSTSNLQVFNGSTYQQVVMPTAGIGDLQVTAGKLAAGAVTTEKVTALGTAAYADSSVTTAKIADSAITAAKIAADSITAAQIAPDAVGASELANDAVDTAAIVDAAVTTAKVGDGAVTTAKLGDLAVTDAKIASGTISYSKLNLADGSVPGAKIAADSVTSAQIGDAAVVTSKLADASVTTAKLADGSVTAAKIAADSITSAQIAPGAVATSELAGAAVTYDKIQATSTTNVVLGRSSAGGGTIEEIPVSAAARDLLADADATEQRGTLGLGTLSTASGTWVDGSSFSGTSSGTNTGDQTITLTGDVTGSGTGSFAATVATGAITTAKIADAAVTSGKIASDAVTAAKLADQSAAIVSAATPSGSGEFVGQQWLNTNTGIEYTWTGAAWQRQAGIGAINITETTPLAFAVTYPDAFSADVNVTLDTQQAATVFAGPTSGADAAPAFRALAPGDLPDATASTKGIIQPGSGLSVSSGTLNHSNAVTGATVSGITFDSQGHISAAVPLVAGDIPVLDASKITTGTFATAQIADDAVTAAKLADYATAQIGEALPVADHIGQIFFNPLDKAFFLWDGNVWQPIGISAGAIVFAGTYDASINQIASVTSQGAAIGLSVGGGLPAASNTNANYYLVVSEGGTGTAPAPTVPLAPPDLILSNGAAWLEIDVSSTYTSQTAGNVAFTPAGQISAINVQAAVEEVSSECRNADNITSGTLAAARGGTGTGSYTKGDLLAASGATALSKLGVGSNGHVLRANSATATGLEWSADFVGTVTNVSGSGAISVANGTTTPAISVAAASTSVAGVVQLSDSTTTSSSTVAATSTAVKSAYDVAIAALPLAGGTVTGALEISNTGSLVFEGSTADAFETTLAVADPTADRTITLPNSTGTVALTSDLDDGTF
jgi:hypothetical protein